MKYTKEEKKQRVHPSDSSEKADDKRSMYCGEVRANPDRPPILWVCNIVASLGVPPLRT